MTAQFIGIGVGTGDADLITLKAHNALQHTNSVIAYIKHPEKPSIARQIVDKFIATDVPEIVITMPMKKDTKPAQDIYDKASKQILDTINQGYTVLFLCEGDPMFYGSFMYIHEWLHTQIKTEIIPGVNSVSSACSVAKFAFASRNDVSLIIPATHTLETLVHHLQSADSIAIIKIGRHLDKVKTALTATQTLDNAVCVINATHPDQVIIPVADVNSVPYFSIIITKKQGLY